MKKHLSSIASDLLQRCQEILEISENSLIEQFEIGLKTPADSYSRRLVEFCSSKAVERMCCGIGERIGDGNFSRLTFNMMLAWEIPSITDEESHWEEIGKEKEDEKGLLQGNEGQMHDDIPLFYSDIMPLLVDEEKSVGEEAFVWLASVLPLVADVVNARFAFEALTIPTANRLYYPGYDRFLKEMNKYINYLQRQRAPTGLELAEHEFILHVEGTGSTQRVVRHIGATSWPGRLTLTNVALYFEANKSVSYENALKIDLSSADLDQQVNAASTGPFGAQLFDKAITYESSQLTEPVILEFPEMMSSTRRDHWLALIKEVTLMHRFILKFKVESLDTKISLQAWDVQGRTILGIMRLHAAREMLRMSPPLPINFLIFTLFDELPKGDYVLEELSNSLKMAEKMSPCTATDILKSLNIAHPLVVDTMDAKEGLEIPPSYQAEESLASLEATIEQVREEARETITAKATVERIRDEGITDSLLVLAELLSPLRNLLPWCRRVIAWESPALSFIAFIVTLIIIYRELFGPALAALLLLLVVTMLCARFKRIGELPAEVVVSPPPSDKTTLESIVAAQYGLKNLDAMVKSVITTILKVNSIVVSRAPQHAKLAMCGLSVTSVLLMIIPFKYVLMGLDTYIFMSNLKTTRHKNNEQGNRRLREWWEAIPVIPVRIVSNS